AFSFENGSSGDSDHVNLMRSAGCGAGAAPSRATAAHPSKRAKTLDRVQKAIDDMKESFEGATAGSASEDGKPSLTLRAGNYGASFGASTPCSFSVESARVFKSTTRIRCAFVSARYNFPSA